MTQTEKTTEKQGRYIQANGINIYYEEAGRGLPLILIHGGGSTGRSWQPCMPTLAEQYHVIAPDSRGHGLSDNPDRKLSYRMMAEDVAAFIRTLNLDRPLICGYSDGGQVALELAMHHPKLCRAFAVGGASYEFLPEYYDAMAFFGIDRSGTVDLTAAENNVPQIIELFQTQHHPEIPDYWKELVQQSGILWTTPLNYSDANFRSIVDPVLIFSGDRDELIDFENNALRLYKTIPGAELAVFPNANHIDAILNLINDLQYLPVILNFFHRHES